jgi:hypothetical protein
MKKLKKMAENFCGEPVAYCGQELRSGACPAAADAVIAYYFKSASDRRVVIESDSDGIAPCRDTDGIVEY